MNRRRGLAGAAIGGGVSLLLLWFWSSRASQPISTVPSIASSPTGVSPLQPPPSIEDTERKRQVMSLEKAREVFQLVEAANVAIEFWGEIVDQDGKPLENVKIAYDYSVDHGNTVGVPWIERETKEGVVQTNPAGLFSIVGVRGHYLSIKSLAKTDFQYRSKGAMIYNFYGDTPEGKFTSHQDKPVVFTMIHKGVTEALTHYREMMEVPGDGTPLRWGLWSAQVEPNGELQITLKREPPVLTQVGQGSQWSAFVEEIGGGIIEASPDETVHRAPIEGYAPIVDYPTVQQKRGVPERSFYVKTSDGRYGRLELRLYPDDEGAVARCFIEAYLNPFGSRNLDPIEEE